MYFTFAEPPKYSARIIIGTTKSYTPFINEFAIIKINKTIYFRPMIARKALSVIEIQYSNVNGERVGHSNQVIPLCAGDQLNLSFIPWKRTITITNRKGKFRQFNNIHDLTFIDKEWARKAYYILTKTQIPGPGIYNIPFDHNDFTINFKVEEDK